MSYRISVRALCEFTAKVGDLDLRFTPSPTALEGIQGHLRVTAGRPAGYEREVSLSLDFEDLQVRGRADGYDASTHCLEEIKTHRGDLSRQPDNHRQLHWAQARLYGWMLCEQRQLAQIELALVYLDVDSDRQTRFEQTWQAEDLREYFERLCRQFLGWARQEMLRTALRNTGLQALAFPHGSFRSGQRQLAETVYKAVSTGRCLMAQATTGIGKTLGTLFPMLKAMVPQQLDKIFFLTAKTPGRQLALDALRQVHSAQPDLPLRVLELVARDKACEHPDKACHGDACPLAKGFYDRLPAARAEAAKAPLLDRAHLRDIALSHDVCPYYLSQEMARWVDVVVGDYNYYFDQSALLFGLAQEHQWRLAVLVDEAHNLVERGRQMYSASLDQRTLQTLRKQAPAVLKTVLQRVNREWNALHKAQIAVYQAYDTPPTLLLLALQRCVAKIGDLLNEQPEGLAPELMDFYFTALQFTKVAELFDDGYVFDISLQQGPRQSSHSRLCLRNAVPARLLGPRLAATRSCVLFSATLSPRHYFADLLGMPADYAWLDVQSPFAAEQLEVQLAAHISTRYSHRQASLVPIAELIARQFAQRPGNYLAFFSSFDYLQQVAALVAERYPQLALWLQERQMDEARRGAFIERFQAGGQGIGFAVLGGAFGEGIDLPGSRLIGAFVATLGLAQVNPVNEQLKQRLQLRFGAGYDYTYLYPGLQKVVQAAGRVIRGVHDQGVVVLIDDRFAEAKVQALLPNWWPAPIACA
ncbi:ATP-dependent DNA helicase [Pseudomonas baltica]|uniref:ATP-dependent DNA helicase n=1 Tax=Pseudomonas baltica TaxID=2762576 RepID=UPI002896C11F|nr:ATP-dependent DNA helicase [Pseudomonas baltica]